ncbi:MAG TPA: SDR family oxidoreductase [Vicinamibacterales bacterium]|jgi:3-oxoacyl-[acyl-carrier protein] reductase|nr:SDR family oxidoreductase [Vicinamibacterales bacterium]
MELGLAGKCALVCAASRGLGKAAARALADEGAAVAICGRHVETLERAAAEINGATGAQVVPVVADVGRGEDIARLISTTVKELGALDVLVTNTGGPRSAPFEAIEDQEWNAAIASLLMGVVRLSRAALPHMRARGAGRIINITSVSVKQPIEGLALSNAIRAAVTGLAKTLATELAHERILVNCVAPGYTATDRVIELAETAAKREGTTPEAVQKRTEARIPLGRMGTPEEFGAAVAFLASDRASYITGVTLQVDGGYVRSLI